MFFVKNTIRLCTQNYVKFNHYIKYPVNDVLLSRRDARQFHLSYALAEVDSAQHMLSPNEANKILRENEQSFQLQEGVESNWDEALATPSTHAIISVDSNYLASNDPIEDQIASAQCLWTHGFLFGVFDGHGGPECSHIVSKRLFDYIAASLLPRSDLQRILSEWESGEPAQLTKYFNGTSEFIPELQHLYDTSLLRWCQHLLHSNVGQEFIMEEALTAALQQLDEDLGREVLENKNEEIHDILIRTVLSGSVACVAHIDGPHLHIANVGDCGCVIGQVSENENGGWVVVRLSQNHSWENPSEVKRVLSEHPKDEHATVLQSQRLLGTLMPFRAFGDFRFKWDVALQERVFGSYIEEDHSFLSFCITPPYLVAKPEVTYHHLNPHQKFLIIASDGLWESLGALDIVTIVGDYMAGRQTLQPVRLPRRHVTLGEVSDLLVKRREWLKLKPVDTNAATHLIRHCLGSTEEGLDHYRLSHSLTLPPHVRRYFRDDITMHVIFFDSNFVRVCPIEL